MRIGIFFFLLSILSLAAGALAVASGSAWLLPLVAWPALAFLLVALAYVKLGARLFCKRADGTLPLAIILLLLPYFLLTWGIWRLLRLGKEPCYNLVSPGIYLGRRPIENEMPREVSLAIDLTAEFPRPPGLRAGCEYRCLPTLDGFVPSFEECRQLVDDIAVHPGAVYVHCAQGHGRSALVAGALLVRKTLASNASDAEAMLKAARPGVRMSAAQRKLLQQLTASHSSANKQ